MTYIEVKTKKISTYRGKASVHLIFEDGSCTISNILIRQKGDQIKITMPLMEMGDNKRPCITLQGELKQDILAEIKKSYCSLL